MGKVCNLKNLDLYLYFVNQNSFKGILPKKKKLNFLNKKFLCPLSDEKKSRLG